MAASLMQEGEEETTDSERCSFLSFFFLHINRGEAETFSPFPSLSPSFNCDISNNVEGERRDSPLSPRSLFLALEAAREAVCISFVVEAPPPLPPAVVEKKKGTTTAIVESSKKGERGSL